VADTTITWPTEGTDVALRVSGSFTSTPFVYVADFGNNRIQVTDFEGNPLFTFGAYGTGDGKFSSPYGVKVINDRVYVTDSGNNRVQYFDLLGTYLGQWGTTGTGEGEFNNPLGIDADEHYVYVVDSGNNRFQIFTKDGTFVLEHCEYGTGSSPDVLNAPTKCYVDEFFLWIDDTGNGYIKWYRLSFFEAYGDITLPVSTVSGTGYWPSGRGAVTLPVSTVSAEGSTIQVGTGSITVPVSRVSAQGITINVGQGAITLPVSRVSAEAIAALVGAGAIILPVSTVSGSGFTTNVGTGAIILPVGLVSSEGFTVLVNPDYAGITMNMRNKGLTTYAGYEFNSLAVDKDGHVYGANDNGIYLLEGDSDNGVDIDAYIKTGVFDLHDPQVQRLVDAWLSLRTSGSGVLTVFENEETEGSSEDVTVEDTNMHDERVTLPQGLQGRFVEFQYENVDGTDFDFSGLTAKTRVLRRTR